MMANCRAGTPGGRGASNGAMASFHFIGGCSFEPASGELSRDGVVTRLEPQPAALLALLASRAGEVVTYDDIRRVVWPAGTHVDFREGTHYAVRQVRRAFGDPARDGLIETIPRRGYRLRADALIAAAVEPPIAGGPGGVTIPVPARRRTRLFVVALAVAAGVALTVVVERRPNNHHATAVAILAAVHDLVY